MANDINMGTIMEYFIDYLQFFVDFAKTPVNCLQSYKSNNQTKINKKLGIFLFLAVVVSFLISVIASALGVVVEDEGFIATAIKSIELEYLPFVLPLIILAVAVVFHIAAQIYILIEPIGVRQNKRIKWGTIWDTINASFAFAAFYIPLSVTIFFFILVPLAQLGSYWLFIGISSLILNLLFFYYFVKAITAFHTNISFWQAFFVLCGGTVMLYYIVSGIGYLVRLL